MLKLEWTTKKKKDWDEGKGLGEGSFVLCKSPSEKHGEKNCSCKKEIAAAHQKGIRTLPKTENQIERPRK